MTTEDNNAELVIQHDGANAVEQPASADVPAESPPAAMPPDTSIAVADDRETEPTEEVTEAPRLSTRVESYPLPTPAVSQMTPPPPPTE